MDKNEFLQYLHAADFRQLFVNSGWDNPTTTTPYRVSVGEATYSFTEAAQKKGFRVYVCKVEKMPDSSVRRVIDSKLRKASHEYLAVYVGASDFHHLWSVPVKSVDKRQLVTIEYAEDEQANFLREKLGDVSFALEEEPTIIEVINKVNAAFLVNKDDVTKKFYQGFRKQHDQFVKCIEGIDDKQEREWYSSVMLNRLMFCYFVQKKEFLNLDPMYLQHKLVEVQVKRGEDKFYGTFYKRFLRKLFEDGLNSTGRSERFLKEFGRIPYLNGGMFELHALEKKYKDIDIPDKVFKSLFDFFDQWRWHLDTHLTGTGRDINPDVLGYIFEQYINDRAQMGAYYTKEDITEYIGRNCIIPYLLGKVLAASPATAKWVWAYLRKSGDRYIFPAMLKGIELSLPDYIERGVSTEGRDLRARRSRWNEKADESYALPTEIWRETVARRQRCQDLRDRIKAGTITDIHDFITYNLDIRTFVEDLIRATDDHLFVLHFYNALREVTILDPTCGSGAFLFAALNILEPLYEACLDRMEEFHEKNKNLFKEQLAEIKDKYRSNQKYFIYKNIILRNLYGVDIMHEATEIARLRLFLKMMAVVDVDPYADNLGLDPLPDIDFNIKCGNTLVGYASECDVLQNLEGTDLFVRAKFEKIIKDELPKLALAQKRFREIQLVDGFSPELSAAKKDANVALQRVKKQLNALLYESSNAKKTFENWMKDSKPLHWVTEFYEIMRSGGFDVVIGNPPYVEYPSADVSYAFSTKTTNKCGNLYGNCTERGMEISKNTAMFGFIVPVAVTCSKRMQPVIECMRKYSKGLWFSNYDDRPGKLFEMIEHLRATIFLISKGEVKSQEVYSTGYRRWYTEGRSMLFQTINYVGTNQHLGAYTIPKFSFGIECEIDKKLLLCNEQIANAMSNFGREKVYYRAAGGGYFLLIKNKKSETSINGVVENVKAEKSLCIDNCISNNSIGALLSSSLFYWSYVAHTDCRNLSLGFIEAFKAPIASLRGDTELSLVGAALFKDYERHKTIKDTCYSATKRKVRYDEYYPKLSKSIINLIDEILARHYGLSEEELDFIINYDIKYRMGEGLNEARE